MSKNNQQKPKQVQEDREPPETLRDRFAMAALTGDWANDRNSGSHVCDLAIRYYSMADAMVAERKKPPTTY